MWPKHIQHILCIAYRRGITSDKYVWIFEDKDMVWEADKYGCTANDLSKSVEGAFYFSAESRAIDGTISTIGQVCTYI